MRGDAVRNPIPTDCLKPDEFVWHERLGFHFIAQDRSGSEPTGFISLLKNNLNPRFTG